MAQNTTQLPKAHLQSIPPEIRTDIFAPFLVGDEPIDIKLGWPALFKACSQFEAEGMIMYLSRNRFEIMVDSIHDPFLRHWLDKVTKARLASPELRPELEIQGIDECFLPKSAPDPSVAVLYPQASHWNLVTRYLRQFNYILMWRPLPQGRSPGSKEVYVVKSAEGSDDLAQATVKEKLPGGLRFLSSDVDLLLRSTRLRTKIQQHIPLTKTAFERLRLSD